MFWYFNFREFRRSGISCSEVDLRGSRRNPETKILDFIERWIKFALPQIIYWLFYGLIQRSISQTFPLLEKHGRNFQERTLRSNYLIYKFHFQLLKLFFFKTWFHVQKMAIVSVLSHSLSTRIDCSVFSLWRSKSSLMAIRVVTGTFI